MLVSPLTFAQSVGTVTFKTGNPTITHADKTTSAAEKNTVLNAGDTIETGDGRLQLSLIDGGKVSLQPNTVYRINKYEFSGKEDGSEYAFTELVKGGLRTVSGLIGHKNRDRYQLKTAVATIGIRGTEFTVNFFNNQLLMTTNHGSVDVCNQGGCLNALSGITIGVAGIGAAPKFSKTAAVAAVTAPSTTKLAFAANDTVTDTGTPLIIANSPQAVTANPNPNPNPNPGTGTGTGTGTTYFSTLFVATSNVTGLHNNALLVDNVTTDGVGNVTVNQGAGLTTTYALDTPTNEYEDSYVRLGRSKGTKIVTNLIGSTSESLADFQGIFGTLTTATSLSNLGSLANPVATYNVLASTAPISITGSPGAITTTLGTANQVTGNLTVNFSTLAYGYSLNNIAVGNNTFSVNASGLSLATGSNINSFSAGGTVTETSGLISGLTTCLLSCTGELSGGSVVQGAFFGANAERAGLQYGFTTNTVGDVMGSVVLGTQPVVQ